MSEQAPDAPGQNAPVTGESAESGAPPKRIPLWVWPILAIIIVAGSFAAGLWAAPEDERGRFDVASDRSDQHGDPQVAFVATTPTSIPTLALLLPTPTPTSEISPVAEAEPVTVAVAAADVPMLSVLPAVPLPTVTPTPEPPPVAPRSVEIGGQANLRMQIASPDFQSAGRPLQIPIERRTYQLDGDTPSVSDQWCVQMGLVNLDIALTLNLHPTNSSVQAVGEATLYNDFCDNRGQSTDSTPINLTIPADARVQSVHNLFGERQLFNLAGLLDMDTGVIVELNIANLRP